MSSDPALVHTFREVWAELSGIGRAPDGGYLRFAWSPAEVALRDWFRVQAARRRMTLTEDGNGNLFATWSPAADEPASGAMGNDATSAGRAVGGSTAGAPASGPGVTGTAAGHVPAAGSPSGAAASGPAATGAGLTGVPGSGPATGAGVTGARESGPATGAGVTGVRESGPATGAGVRGVAGSSSVAAGVGRPGGVLTGSHFDSVPHGGAYDGPLGIVSAFLAVDLLRERAFRPVRPITVAAFAEEEGSRFGVACLGSRLLTGTIDPERAAALTDRDGLSLGDVFGAAPAGARPDLVAGFDAYVELHVEQGRALTGPVGVASAIWPHGRWRFDVEGEGNHAGTTLMTDRRDPMLTYAFTVLAANKEARLRGAHATVGRVEVTPNATNAIPAAVRGWLDARAADDETLASLVEAVTKKATERAGRDGTGIRFTAESTTGEVRFDVTLAERLAALLGGVPILPTGAGHDAGVLSAHLPTAMLFVRNPTGVSHAPAESATDADCAAGVQALAQVLEELSARPLVDHDKGVAP